jgi:hypothetical protein
MQHAHFSTRCAPFTGRTPVLDWSRPHLLFSGKIRFAVESSHRVQMKPEYIEGPQATANFERFASAILQANPKKKKKQVRNPASKRKPKKSDKD